ncbi:CRISPR-associated endonuclease Cas2 [Patescibacteria group bacterium]|nr:CRISPR-associated endonuclease Cas2 [Patescibacteria group bacterium]
MGKMEEGARKRRRKQNIQTAVLMATAGAGLLAWAAIAPKTLQLLKYVPGQDALLGYRARTAAGRLVTKGYAKWVKSNGMKFLRLTATGERAFALEKAKAALSIRPRKWDGRWRMVAFDVPERQRRVRAQLRSVMADIGFLRLQDSVWVYPYDCEDFVAMLKADLKIGRSVLYAIVDSLEGDAPLRAHFMLPKG